MTNNIVKFSSTINYPIKNKGKTLWKAHHECPFIVEGQYPNPKSLEGK